VATFVASLTEETYLEYLSGGSRCGGEAVHSKYEVKSIGKGNVLQSAVLRRVPKCSRGSRATRPTMGYVAQASSSPRALTKSRATPKEDICGFWLNPTIGHSYLLTAGNILLPFRRMARIGASGQQCSSRVHVCDAEYLGGIALAESRRLEWSGAKRHHASALSHVIDPLAI
jgi:hypothetical protein